MNNVGPETNEETEVSNGGHKFVMLYSPWLRLGEGTFKVKYNPELDEADSERFENSDNKVQGQLREIKELLGDQLFDELSSEAWIAKAVSHNFNKYIRPLQNLTMSSVYESHERSALKYSYSPPSSLCCAL